MKNSLSPSKAIAPSATLSARPVKSPRNHILVGIVVESRSPCRCRLQLQIEVDHPKASPVAVTPSPISTVALGGPDARSGVSTIDSPSVT